MQFVTPFASYPLVNFIQPVQPVQPWQPVQPVYVFYVQSGTKQSGAQSGGHTHEGILL